MKKRIIYTLITLAILFAVTVTTTAPIAFADETEDTELVDTGFVNNEESEGVIADVEPLYTDLEGFKSIAKNDKLELLMKTDDKYGFIFAVKDNASSDVWYSTSSLATKLASDTEVMRATSVGIVHYSDTTGAIKRLYTNEAFRAGNYKTENVENGIRITFEFPDVKKCEGFTVPFLFRLDGDRFDAGVELGDIKVDKKSDGVLTSIAVLPYFGCADYGQDGYIFVPDGSGAIIDNNYASRDGTVKYYETYIYGYDETIYRTSNTIRLNNSEKSVLPVFGTKADDKGMVGVISSGDALSQVKAVSSREAFPFTSSYAEFIVNKIDKMGEGKKETTRITDRSSNTEYARVSYYLLKGDDADYVGMAEKYREYLIGEGLDNEINENLQFYMDIIGSIKKTESVYGFVMNVTKPITTFEQASDIVNTLNKSGVENLNVRYRGWQKGGVENGPVTDAKAEAKLGGMDGLKEFNALTKKLGANLFLDVDLINIYETKSGWSYNKIAVRDVVSSVSKQYYFKMSNGDRDLENYYYHVSGKYVVEQVNKFLGDYKGLDVYGISAGSLGNTNYSDFFIGNRFNDAQETAEYIKKAAQKLKKEQGNLVVDGGNGYILPYVNTVIAPPMYDSGYEMSKNDVPFLQIALHGVINYTETAHNLYSDPEMQLLRQLETGSAPYFIFTGEESSTFLNTNLNYIYSSQFDTWKETAISNYKELASVFNGYCDKYITDHMVITPEVRCTVYGDELAILVNYSDTDYEYNGIKVSAKGYATVTATELAAKENQGEEVVE